jgi:hypothetical protein
MPMPLCRQENLRAISVLVRVRVLSALDHFASVQRRSIAPGQKIILGTGSMKHTARLTKARALGACLAKM